MNTDDKYTIHVLVIKHMLLNEIFNSEIDVRSRTLSPEIVRLEFSIEDIVYYFTAQTFGEDTTTWMIDVSTDNPTRKPNAAPFRVLSGIIKSVEVLLQNVHTIEHIIFHTKDTDVARLYHKFFKTRVFPGWKFQGERQGWFKFSKE